MRVRLGLIALLTLATPQAVWAHAMLMKAEPAVGSSVTPAPAQITLHYSEGVEPLFTTVVVTDAAGVRVDSGSPKIAPGDPKTLLVGLKPLKPGDYTVDWHVTSVDTHKTQGHFSFTVAP
jgi:methionine-rich copper-binding protein CopC